MKNWILTHKLLTVILACVIGAGAVCAVVLPITLRHEHKFSAEWTTDENYHWHECIGKKCKKVSDKAAHVFDKEEASETYLASAATYTDAARYYKSCICGVKGTETFSHGSPLSAKENVVGLKDGVTLGKTYDGEAYTLSEEQISRNGNGAITFTYKLKDSEAEFAEAAPENAGEYTVKVSVAATAEWKAATKTFDFAITPMVIGVDWEHSYDNSNVISGEPAELLEGEEAMITVTMSSANVGATVQNFEITGKDAGNYSLAREDVNVDIVKADINFEISNASAFNELFFVGATNIPDPTTNYVEIGTGYGAKTIDWIRHLGDGVWSRTLTKDEVVGTAGEYRVRIKYAEGDNYNFGATQYVSFTVKKENVLTIKNIIGPDGNPIAGITDSTLGIKFGEDRINMQAQIDGLCEYLTNADNAEKYFIIRVQCGETVIARFERRGVQTMSDLHYVYTYGGMSFDNDRVTGMHFDLFGANEYVSAEGKWIGNEDLEVTIEITDSKDHPVLSKDSLQNSSSVGGSQIAVFEVQLPEGDDIICTFDVSWSGSPKNIEMVLYDAVTGSETSIVVNKVGENKFTFTETSGRKSFYLYVEELEATNNASGFTITASFKSLTRLNFTGNVASDKRFYSKDTSVKFIVGVGDASSEQDLKYTITLDDNNNDLSYQVHDKQGNVIELVDGSFTIPAGTSVEDYIITVTCEKITVSGHGAIGKQYTLTVTKEIVAA